RALARHRARDREGARVPRSDQGDGDPRVAGRRLREVSAAGGRAGATVRRRPRTLQALLERRRAPRLVPEPPIEPPAGRIVHVPGRGEFFLRDSGGDGPALLLLHGWMVSADLNFLTVYDALADAGYRVLALDHRGHGRGLRTPQP